VFKENVARKKFAQKMGKGNREKRILLKQGTYCLNGRMKQGTAQYFRSVGRDRKFGGTEYGINF
jgi:hypothetical protein